MNLYHDYYWFKEAISHDVCDAIIKMGEKQLKAIQEGGGEVSGTTRSNDERQSGTNLPSVKELTPKEAKEKLGDYYIRDCNVAWFNDQWLYDLIWPYLETANSETGWNWDIDWAESFQFTKYDKDGLYGWHNDGGSDHFGKYILGEEDKESSNPYTDDKTFEGKVRKISMTLNLSRPEDFEGGELKFDLGKTHDTGVDIMECAEIKAKGSMIFFPSFKQHTVTPITKGTRYSLVLWALGKPWR